MKNLIQLNNQLENVKHRYYQLKGVRQSLLLNKEKCEKVINTSKEDIQYIDKANIILSLISEKKRENVIKLFEETVTASLQSLFNDNYVFKIEQNKRNKIDSFDFVLKTDEYNDYLPIKNTQGNSVKQVVSVMLRIIFTYLLSGRKFIVLDESFAGVEIDKEQNVALFLQDICKKFNIQLIIVTHKQGIANALEGNLLEI